MILFKPDTKASIFYLNILILCIQRNAAFPGLSKQKNSTFKQILDAESNNKVPEYETVQLRILSKRSTDDQDVIRVHLSAFGKDIHLRLERNDDFEDRSRSVKFSKGSFTDTGVQLTEVNVEDDDPGIPYIDLAQMAAVTIRYGPDGELLMDGVIGDEFLIKPEPTHVYPGDYIVYDWRPSDYEYDFDGYSTSAPIKGIHVVYRNAMKLKSPFKVVVDGVIKTTNSTDSKRGHKRRLHAFPEVLLMVDYDSYALHVSHGLNDAQIKRYYVSFMNGVDLRFKTLSNPRISLVLNRIVIFKNRDDTPFLKSNMLPDRNLFDGYNALGDLSHHLYSFGVNYPAIDMAILLTKLDMCTNDLISCDHYTLGLAYFQGACNINPQDERWMGVAIVEDNGAFDGILIAAHEMGHLLGLYHDGDPIEDPQFFNCSDEAGYLMSSKLSSNRIFHWSECSINQFRQFLSSNRASCLFNRPSYRNELEGSDLPGAVLSLDEQCKRILGTNASAWDGRVCLSLHCHQPFQHFLLKINKVLPPAAEGSSCGENQHCRHGKCVSKDLTYRQAWNMVPVHNRSEYTRTEPPSAEGACTEDQEDEFCDSYFRIIERNEACKSSRMLEECCYSHNIRCKQLLDD